MTDCTLEYGAPWDGHHRGFVPSWGCSIYPKSNMGVKANEGPLDPVSFCSDGSSQAKILTTF